MKKKSFKIPFYGNFIFRCLQCCMACFERFMKYINVNAYIETGKILHTIYKIRVFA